MKLQTAFLLFALLPCYAQTTGALNISHDPNDWPMYNHDVVGTRFNSAEQQLTPESVQRLGVKWFFATAGDVYGTPAVVDRTVYAGDTSGTFYALTSAGAVLWRTRVTGPITASALITNQTVIVGDQAGFIYGLNRTNGEVTWSVRPNPNQFAAIYGSAIPVGDQIVIGISSNEDAQASSIPGYKCCSFRGSVVSLNPSTGAQNWQTFLITEQQQQAGSSGAGIWSTPTYDPGTKLIYVTTSNNYTPPATKTSDAFVALNASTGAIVWSHQTVPNDVENLEADFGDSPQVYTLPSGRKVVAAGEKYTATYYVLDAADGTLLKQLAVAPTCKDSEGLFADSAVAYGIAFVDGVNCGIFSNPPLIPPTGLVAALKDDGSQKLWEFTSWFAPVLSGVAVANGVVYCESSGLLSFLYALDAHTGKLLRSVPLPGGISGPSVSHGQVYVGAGSKFASGFGTFTGIVALGL